MIPLSTIFNVQLFGEQQRYNARHSCDHKGLFVYLTINVSSDVKFAGVVYKKCTRSLKREKAATPAIPRT